jgi:hypothetical protein
MSHGILQRAAPDKKFTVNPVMIPEFASERLAVIAIGLSFPEVGLHQCQLEKNGPRGAG